MNQREKKVCKEIVDEFKQSHGTKGTRRLLDYLSTLLLKGEPAPTIHKAHSDLYPEDTTRPNSKRATENAVYQSASELRRDLGLYKETDLGRSKPYVLELGEHLQLKLVPRPDQLTPRISAFSPLDTVRCRYLGDDEAALAYLISQMKLSRMWQLRDTHVRQQAFRKYLNSTRDAFQGAIRTFMARDNTQIQIVAGRVVDPTYVEQFIEGTKPPQPKDGRVQQPVEARVHAYRLLYPSPLLNFMLLDYTDGKPEVLFGWGRHGNHSSEAVFSSDDERLVHEFENFYELLKQPQIAKQVKDLAALKHPLPELSSIDDIPGAATRSSASEGVRVTERWDRDFIRQRLRLSEEDAAIKILITFFSDETDLMDILDELLLNTSRKIEILLMDPANDALLAVRYQPEIRSITASSAKRKIEGQLQDFLDYQAKLRTKKGRKGSLKVLTHKSMPHIVLYQIGDTMYVGNLLTHASFENGPMITVQRGERLWDVYEETWNACLKVTYVPKGIQET